jgi:hypothetical protein
VHIVNNFVILLQRIADVEKRCSFLLIFPKTFHPPSSKYENFEENCSLDLKALGLQRSREIEISYKARKELTESESFLKYS